MENKFLRAATCIKEARTTIAFTGAGISVESGIPPFRGPGGLYSRVSPTVFEIESFLDDPLNSWKILLEHVLFPLLKARPNPAHQVLARLEEKGLIKAVITQNIDGLHRRAGSKNVIEFHGTADFLECLSCNSTYPAEKYFPFFPADKLEKRAKSTSDLSLSEEIASELKEFIQNFEVPRCPRCGELLKPAIVFFGEKIPEAALRQSSDYANQADCLLIVGTSGVVYPAALIPQIARANQAHIIEINTEPSEYSDSISTIFIQAPASLALLRIEEIINQN